MNFFTLIIPFMLLLIGEYVMPQVIVEGEPLRLAEETKVVESIWEEDLGFQGSPYMKPEEMFMFVPGVSFEGKDIAGSVPAIRGFARFRTAVYLQGMKVSTEREIGPSLFFSIPDVIQRAEIFKGGSAIFGSDAIGGSVVYFLKGIYSKNEIKLSYNSNNKLLGGYMGYKPFPKVYLGFGGYEASDYGFPDTLTGNGFFTKNGKLVKATNSGFRKYSFVSSFNVWGTTFYGVFFAARDLYRSYKTQSINYYPYIDHIFILFDGHGFEGGFHGYFNRSTKITGDTVENIRYGKDISLRYTFKFGRVVLGFEHFGRFGVYSKVYKNGSFLYDELSNASVGELGVFVLGSFSKPVKVSYGFRGNMYTATNVKGLRFVPSMHIGVKRKPFAINLIFSYRFPNLIETNSYSTRVRGFIKGNPDLLPERGITAEVVYNGRIGSFNFGVVPFVVLVKDYIEMVKINDTIYTFKNLPEFARVYGVEARAVYYAKNLTLIQTLTLMNGESGEIKISDIPPARLGSRLKFNGKLSPFINLFYQAEARDVSEIEERKPQFLVVDMGASYVFKNVNLTFGIYNINNAIAYRSLDPLSLPQPGRSVFIHMFYMF